MALPADNYRVTVSGTVLALPAPIGMWTLDEAAGPTATDSSGAGHPGSHVNVPLVIPGRIGNGLRLNARPERGHCGRRCAEPPSRGVRPDERLCLGSDLSLPAAGTTFPFVCKGLVGQFEYALHVHADATLSFTFSQLTGPHYAEARGGALPLGSWHHLAGTMAKRFAPG